MKRKVVLGLAFQDQKIRGRAGRLAPEYHRRQKVYYDAMQLANRRGR